MSVAVSIRELEGRSHAVVPMVMIVVGVAHGSHGPVFYPAEALKRSVPLWSGKPIVVFHPSLHGSDFAGNPMIFDRQKIGTIFNTSFDGHRLKAEAWLELARIEAVDRRVLDAIRANRMMEVSTGLIVNGEESEGTFNGKPYSVVATSLIPDHLAILPDQIGACSIADGAGLLRNSLSDATLSLPEMAF